MRNSDGTERNRSNARPAVWQNPSTLNIQAMNFQQHTVYLQQVKTAHRKLAAKYHPDNTQTGTEDTVAFIRIQNAYELILHQVF